MSKRNRYKQDVEVAEPRPKKIPSQIAHWKAMEYCNNGLAYWTKEGRLRFRGLNSNPRQGSDVYIDGDFEIEVVNTKISRINGSPRMPVTQWQHARPEKELMAS